MLGLAADGHAASAATLPPGWLDYVAEVRGARRPLPAGDAGAARRDRRRRRRRTARCVARAAARAGELGIPAGGRVLIDAGGHPDPVDWLLAPLAAGASIVLCKDRRCDDARAAARRPSAPASALLYSASYSDSDSGLASAPFAAA